MHRWIQASFARLGINSELAPISFKPKPGQCFVGHEQCDLLWQGRKIAGAAQRRRKEGLLIQGSIQPPPAADRRAWERAMLEVLSSEHRTKWRPFEWTAQLEERAATLARSKYSQPAYNEGR
jgi:lipoate-protein ligase A